MIQKSMMHGQHIMIGRQLNFGLIIFLGIIISSSTCKENLLPLKNYDVIVINRCDDKIELNCSNINADIRNRVIEQDTFQQISLVRFDSEIDPRTMYLNLAFLPGDSLSITKNDSAIIYINTGFDILNAGRSLFNVESWELDSIGANYGDVRLPDIIYTVYQDDFD